mmetsp:Transcript_16994/g.37132  ORF Transcript_16994/g.37132 Transcript_16994/m.37132 type:complete len:1009 (-) Transcript_16994:24-3050(-)
MKYTNFDELTFRNSVEKALRKVKAILVTEKNPRMAEEESDHKWDDKYGLAEFLTNTSVASQLNILEQLGLDEKNLEAVMKWVEEEKQTVTMHFQAEDGCSFLKEQEQEISTTDVTTETRVSQEAQSSFFGATSTNWNDKKTTRVIQRVKEYHWKVFVSYKLKVFKGDDPSSAIELQSRNATTTLVTSGGQATARRGAQANKPIPPIIERTVHPATEVDLTWLFQKLDDKTDTTFSIDRSADSCRTPRRNKEVQEAYEYHQSLVHWMLVVLNFFLDRMEKDIMAKHNPVKIEDPQKLAVGTKCQMVGIEKDQTFNGKYVIVREYLVSADRYRVEPMNPSDGLPASLTIRKTNLKVDTSSGPMLSSVSVEDIFTPILPLMENFRCLSMPDANALLAGQKSSIQNAFEVQIQNVFPPRQLAKLASQAEAMILLLCTHWLDVIEHYQNSMNYIENMIRKQLVQAIGNEVNQDDFDAFMRFHNQKLYGPLFAPKPFTYAIRRPRHYPDGILSIESTNSQSNESINTMVRHVPGADSPPIFIPINAATSIEMTGDRYLHGWMQHRFETSASEGTTSAEYRLVARARQFSSFLLVIGTMAGADKFDPKASIILQNKDEVMIPLLTKVLPTAKEFKDAIASLSPEQQAFCQAFRGMQLESSVFGVCVIQLKPQLEALLGLPAGALTKEIQLTQDLMSLFMEYQIPSDLLTFEGSDSVSPAGKLSAVKGHVKSVLDVITAEKEKQLLEEERRADMRYEQTMLAEDAVVEMDMATVSSSMVPQASTVSIAPEERSRAKKSLSPRRMLKSKQAVPAVPPGRPSPKGRVASKNIITAEHVQPSSRPTPSKVGQTQPSASQQAAADSAVEDFTLVPKKLDAKFADLDTDNSLRSTILSATKTWTRLRQENLLSSLKSSVLRQEMIESEKNKAFDLLDAISRSGTLPIACSELHVIISVSHCFENDVMGTVIQDNIDPISKIEKSSLIIGSTIFGESCEALLAESNDAERLAASFPSLFIKN